MSKEVPRGERFASEVVYGFLNDAIEDGAIYRYLEVEEKNLRRPKIIRNLQILLRYYYTPATGEEIGKIYDLKPQAVHLQKKRMLGMIWEVCSEEIQEKFPLEQVLEEMRKPRGVETRLRISEKRGGNLYKVVRLHKERKTVEEIIKELEMTIDDVVSIRHPAAEMGIEFPLKRKGPKIYSKIKKGLEKTNDNHKIQDLLDLVDINVLSLNKKSKEPILVSIRKVTEDIFAFDPGKTIRHVESLKNAKVPIGLVEMGEVGKKAARQKYYVIAEKHLDWAKEVLENDPKLDDLRKKKFFLSHAEELFLEGDSVEANDLGKIQEALDLVDYYFLLKDAKKEKPLLASIRKVTEDIFAFDPGKTIRHVESLKNAGVPVGSVVKERLGKTARILRRYFIAGKHSDWAREVLGNDPDLDDLRIKKPSTEGGS